MVPARVAHAVKRAVEIPYRAVKVATFVPRTLAVLLFWLACSLATVSVQWLVVLYAASRISIDCALFALCVATRRVLRLAHSVPFIEPPSAVLLRKMRESRTYEEWHGYAARLDLLEGRDRWKDEAQSALFDHAHLRDRLHKLAALRRAGLVLDLVFALRTVLDRKFCGLANRELFSHANVGTIRLVEDFRVEVARSLLAVFAAPEPSERPAASPPRDVAAGQTPPESPPTPRPAAAADAAAAKLDEDEALALPALSRRRRRAAGAGPLGLSLSRTPDSDAGSTTDAGYETAPSSPPLPRLPATPPPVAAAAAAVASASAAAAAPAEAAAEDGAHALTRAQKLEFFRTAAHGLGRTALCLSGGGSLAMYHMGVVKELVARGLMPRVISGTSGGSIVAALLAVHTDEEMARDMFRADVSSRHGRRWFEPLPDQVAHFLRRGVLMDSDEFAATCRCYFGDLTFAEAHARTGRVVNIAVTARYGARGSSHATLLNHSTSPQVLVWSAVCASCALPGLMPPVRLMAKDRTGAPVPYFAEGVQLMDGSIHADVPQQRLAELFHVNATLVSQVNPHVVPFIREGAAARERGLRAAVNKLEYFLNLDIQQRCQTLAKLRLLPKIFGHDVRGVFLQRYVGTITVTPRMDAMDNFKVISHPEPADMERYIRVGARAVWPHLDAIRHLVSAEQVLDACIDELAAAPVLRVSTPMRPGRHAGSPQRRVDDARASVRKRDALRHVRAARRRSAVLRAFRASGMADDELKSLHRAERAAAGELGECADEGGPPLAASAATP